MRLGLSLATMALLLAGSVPALAQNNGQQPIYNSMNGVPYYSAQQNGGVPIYNNGTNVRALPMQQMVAGKNAPSYNYNNAPANPAYTGFNANPLSGVSSIGSLTPQQEQFVRAQRDAQALAYQQQYLQSLQQQQQANNNSGASIYQGSQFSQLYADQGGQQQRPVPTKKRVLYNELNNPLVEPPLLFNPN